MARSLVWILHALVLSQAVDAVAAEPCGEARLTADVAGAAVEIVARSLHESHVGSAAGVAPATLAGLESAARVARHGPRQRELADALNRALVHSEDAHLEVRMHTDAAAYCDRLPVRLLWNSLGLWVRDGTDQVPTGARVTTLGGRSTPALEAALAERIPHEVPQWVRAHGADLLSRVDTLRNLGLVTDEGFVAIEFITPAGATGRARLSLERPPAEAPPPPWVGYEIHGDRGTGYFRFDRFEYNEELAATLDRFLADARAAAVGKVAIDIRGNPGGDSSVAIAILDALGARSYSTFAVVPRPSPALAEAIPPLMPAALNPLLEQAGLPAVPLDAATYLLPPPLVLEQLRARVAVRPLAQRLDAQPRLFLLTDAGTFSSGALFAGIVRDNALGQIVGEAVGNSATFNGTEHAVALPDLPYFLNLSMARLPRPAPTAQADASLEPDVAIAISGADLAAGRDPVLEWVLAVP